MKTHLNFTKTYKKPDTECKVSTTGDFVSRVVAMNFDAEINERNYRLRFEMTAREAIQLAELLISSARFTKGI